MIQLSFYFDEDIFVCPYCCQMLRYVNDVRVKRIIACHNCGQPLLWNVTERAEA